MPTAKFEADFTGFVSGVNQAEAALGDLETGTASTASALESVSSSASGASAAIQETAAATTAAAEAGGVFDDVLQGVIASFGGFGIERLTEKIVEFGVHVVETGAQIEKFAAQTGFTTDQVQELQYAAGQTDTSFETIARAAETLQQKIGSGDKGLQKALDDLGISFDDLKSQSPHDAFLTMVGALHDVEDQSRQNADANDAFSRSYRDLLPLIKGMTDEMRTNAPKMSEEYIKALADMTHAWNDLKSQGVVGVGDVIGAWGHMGTAIDDLAARFKRWNPVSSESARALSAVHDGTQAAYTGIGALIDKVIDVKKPTEDFGAVQHGLSMTGAELAGVTRDLTDSVKEHIKESEPLAKAWEEVRTKAVDYHAALNELDGTVVESVKSLLDMGVSEKSLTAIYELRPDQIHAITLARKDEIQAMKDAQKESDELTKKTLEGSKQIQDAIDKTHQTLLKDVGDSTAYQLAKIQETADKQKAAFKGTEDQRAEYNTAIDQLAAAEAVSVITAADKGAAAHEAAGGRMTKANTDASTASIHAWDDYVRAMGIIATLDTTTEEGARAAAAASTAAADTLNAAMDATAKNLTVVVGSSTTLSSAQTVTTGATQSLGSAMSSLASQLSGAGQPWANQSAALLQNPTGTDPRILNYLSQGYTLSEASAIVSGAGGMISIPIGQRQAGLGQALSSPVTINVNGSVFSSQSAIANAVSQALTGQARAGGTVLGGY